MRGYNTSYPAIQEGKGRCFRFDASRVFPGTVKVSLSLKDRGGRVLRDLSLVYYDLKDFEFTQTGRDGITDEKNLNKDVLDPVSKFLEDPAHGLSDGTLLIDNILYIVVIQGMPYASKAVFGIEHGATTRKGDHGALASLEQRLQTIYYDCRKGKADWDKSGFYPGGMERGVVSHKGRNMKTAPIWGQLRKGVTVSACGAPAYEGGLILPMQPSGTIEYS